LLGLPILAWSQVAELSTLQISNGVLQVAWEEGEAPFAVDISSGLVAGARSPLLTTSNRQATIPGLSTQAAIRVRSLFAPTAQYQLTFTSRWSALTHPVNFPSFPHWSGLVGATHGGDVSFWAPGELASLGIRRVAETGGKTTLIDEVTAAQTAGQVEHVLSGPGVFLSPGGVQFTFDVSQADSLVTLVSMLAPSPDWFSGVHGLPLFDQTQGWLEPDVSLFLYDAGTDGGPSYSSSNDPLASPQVIQLLDDVHTRVGGEIRPVARFIFRRL